MIELASERFTKNLWSDRASAERPRIVNVADDVGRPHYIVENILENREAGIALQSAGRVVPHLEPQRRAGESS